MIARLWSAQIDSRHADEYETFACERSLPMFQAHRAAGDLHRRASIWAVKVPGSLARS